MKARIAAVAVTAFLISGCERENRQFKTTPPAPEAGVQVEYEENAYAVSQGKRLYRWFNCNGCHSTGGGGGMGPALMDAEWRYGHEPEAVFITIVKGRPNGMPAFEGKIPEEQVWQLVAYVRSMSGQLRSDVAPSRSDGLQAGEPENRRERERAETKGPPPRGK
jgi:cytochrome c oxidase cbb3-type subunit III